MCFTQKIRTCSRACVMSFEIERKFLIRSDDWQNLVTAESTIRQAYLSFDGKASVRVRIKDESTATLTVKSRPMRCAGWNWSIPFRFSRPRR